MSGPVTDIQVQIEASIGGFDAKMKSASASASVFERELQRVDLAGRKLGDMGKAAAKVEAAQRKMAAAEAAAYKESASQAAKAESAQRQMASVEASAYRESAARDAARVEAQKKIGQAAVGAGALMLVGLGEAAKAAMDWQAAFAGMAKVLPADTTAGPFGVLDAQLRDLSKSLPVSATEVAALATSAAQLGVPTANLKEFTKAAVLGSSLRRPMAEWHVEKRACDYAKDIMREVLAQRGVL